MQRWKKISLTVVLIVVLAATVTYFYVFRWGGLEIIINSRLESLAKAGYRIEVRIGDVKGDFFTGLVLENIQVRYVDTALTYELADIPRITTGYALANLWNNNYILEYFYVDSALVTLVRDTSGHWLLPGRPAPSDTAGEGPTIPQFEVGALGLHDLTLRLVQGEDTVIFRDITLGLALKGDQKTYSVDVDQLRFESSDNLQLESAIGKLTYSEGRLTFQDIHIISAGTSLKLGGSVQLRGGTAGMVTFNIDNLDIDQVTRYIGPHLAGILDLTGEISFDSEGLEGEVDIGGDFMIGSFENLYVDFHVADRRLYLDTLYGMLLGNCAIDGLADIDFSMKPAIYHLEADIRNFNLDSLIHKGLTSDLNGHLTLDGESFKKEGMLLRTRARLFESVFYDYHFQQAYGDMIITTDSLVFLDSFRIDYYENEYRVAGAIEYRDELNLSITGDLANLNRYEGKFVIDQPGGRGRLDAVMSGKTTDPDLSGKFTSDSVWIYDMYGEAMTAEVDLKRFLSGKQGYVNTRLLDGSAWGLPYDTCFARFTVDSNLVYIDTAYLHNQYSRLCAAGVLDYGPDPMTLVLDTLTTALFDRRFYNRNNLEIDIDSAGFDLRRIVIGNNGARLSVSGRADFDESIDLQASVENIPVAPWLGLFETEWSVDGYLSGETSLGGTRLEPVFEIDATVDSLVYKDLVLGDLSLGAHYRDRRVDLDSAIIMADPGIYRADGYLHMDAALTTDSMDRFPDLSMDINITASDRRFDLVSLVLPSVEQLNGDFTADFNLSGTPNEPRLEGGASIHNARLKYFDIEEPILADEARIRMNNNLIIVDGIQAYAIDTKKGKKKRYANIEGEIEVRSLENFYYNLDVSLPREFPFTYELEEISGRIEGDMHIEGESPPEVTGDLTLLSMKYRANFAEPNEGSPIMAGLTGENSWDLDLNIDILSNYWIQNSDINAEFAGQINVIRKNGLYSFIGDMEVLRGTGFLFDKTFRLDPGGQVLFEGGEDLNAELDIIGRTRIATVSQSVLDEENASPEDIELAIHITGTLEVPEINPVEGSDFSTDDILPLLLANSYSADGVEASGRIEQRLTGVIGSQISQIGSRRLSRLGVETFEIDPYYAQGQFDPLQSRVTIGFYTATNLYVYGSSALSLQSGQAVGFEYRLNKNFMLEGSSDEDQLYQLSLKLHWDF